MPVMKCAYSSGGGKSEKAVMYLEDVNSVFQNTETPASLNCQLPHGPSDISKAFTSKPSSRQDLIVTRPARPAPMTTTGLG